MTLRDRLCQALDIEPTSLIMAPLWCRRTTRSRGVVEEIHAIYLFSRSSRVAFKVWPGVTGYESSYVDDALERLERLEKDFVPQEGMFGPTRWEDELWSLCAGNNVYDSLQVSYGELREALQYMTALQQGVPMTVPNLDDVSSKTVPSISS